MNDLMSAGMHRLWKRFAVEASGIRKGGRVLDIAGGTADLSALFMEHAGSNGEVWLTDINNSMLTLGRDRLLDQGAAVPVAQCDAEKLPFPGDYFDCVSVAFGLRNMTHKDRALKEMLRVLRPGGCVIVLEFSKIWKPLQRLYDAYSFNLLPAMGSLIAKDQRQLSLSCRVHSHASFAGRIEAIDATGGVRTRRIFQPGGRRGCPPSRLQVLGNISQAMEVGSGQKTARRRK